MRMARHVLREEDRAGAGAPHRHAVGDALAELWDDLVTLCELSDRRALATGDDQRVDIVELLGPAHIDRIGAERAERCEMLGEVALKTEDTDPRARRSTGVLTSRGRQGVRRAGSSRAQARASARRARAIRRR